MKQALMFHSGQFVFYEGHAVLGLYILCTGRVKLTRSTLDGQRRLANIIDPGCALQCRHFKMPQSTKYPVTCLNRHRFVFSADPSMYGFSREMGPSLIEVDQFALASLRERLASLLLQLSVRYGETVSEGLRITLEFKREELVQ